MKKLQRLHLKTVKGGGNVCDEFPKNISTFHAANILIFHLSIHIVYLLMLNAFLNNQPKF